MRRHTRAEGRVLEVAVGTGRNVDFYPPEVSITGVDISPGMLAIARQHATDLGLDVDLREADAQELPFDDDSFDTAVCVLSLCTITDPRRMTKHPQASPPNRPPARRRALTPRLEHGLAA